MRTDTNVGRHAKHRGVPAAHPHPDGRADGTALTNTNLATHRHRQSPPSCARWRPGSHLAPQAAGAGAGARPRRGSSSCLAAEAGAWCDLSLICPVVLGSLGRSRVNVDVDVDVVGRDRISDLVKSTAWKMLMVVSLLRSSKAVNCVDAGLARVPGTSCD
jgi:hypothetical protein